VKNILLITIDSLRASQLAASNQTAPAHILHLANRGVCFTQAFATGPRTAESFPAILASTYPISFGGTWRLPPDLVSIAQVLASAGLATAAFHSNPYLSANLGYDRGFQVFWDSSQKTPITTRLGARFMAHLHQEAPIYRLLRRFARQFESSLGLAHYVRAQPVTSMAVRWLQNQPRPFFLWLHYMDLHYPYAPPPRLLQQVRTGGLSRTIQADLMVRSLENPASITPAEKGMLLDLYLAALLSVDEQVGRLLEALSNLQILHDTFIILTSDHGEEFQEHGQFGHAGQVHDLSAGQPRIRLYDELLHVPLIFHGPGLQPHKSDQLVSLIDLPPTIIDLLGISPVSLPDITHNQPLDWQGLSLKPLLLGDQRVLRRQVFAEYAVRDQAVHYPVIACRTKDWKYIHDGVHSQHHLYHLVSDPAEHHNLYQPDHPALPPLQDAVNQHLELARNTPYPLSTQAKLDPLLLERMRSLGYME